LITIKKIILFLFLSQIVWAQTGRVKGKVASEGNPLLGVNILVSELGTGTVTDENGNYLLEGIVPGNYTLRFSTVGFETEFIKVKIIKNRTLLLNVNLKVKVIEVQQVEVTDSGGQNQSDTRVSLINVKPNSARVLPGAVTDVFRTLQALPGVLAPNDFSSQLIVRGSGPDQNLIVMDDIEIFNPYRLYGVVSMFNPEAVSSINLISAGFPAEYGDRLSAVLNVGNREGTLTKNFAGNLNASIVSANLVLEGKNPFNLPGSWLINSRRTYYDLILEPFVKNSGLVEENVSFPNFYDIQAKFVIGPFKGHKFLLNGISSRDAVEVISGKERKTPDSVSVKDNTFNEVAGFAWHYSPSKKVLNKFIVSYYRNKGDANFAGEFLDPSLNRDQFENTFPDTLGKFLFNFGFNSNFTFRKISLEDKFLYFYGRGNEFDAGGGVDFIRTILAFNFQIDPQFQAFIDSNPNFRSSFNDLKDIRDYYRVHTYVQNKFNFSDVLYLFAGMRFDYYGILEKAYFSPRISLSYIFDEINTLRASWGIYYQSPGYEKLRDQNLFYDLSQNITNRLNAERAIHYVLSYERWLNNEWRAKIETYYKKFDDLILPKRVSGTTYYTELIPGKNPRYVDSWTRPVPVQADSITQLPVNDSFGHSYGIEILLEKKNLDRDSKLDGWISYAFAIAERYEYNKWIPFRFDQRHTLNVILNYSVNDWMSIGTRFQYGSGFPINAAVGIKPRIILVDNDGDFLPETPEIAHRSDINGRETVNYDIDYGGPGNRFNSRRPEYHRLDVRLNFFAKFWGLDWTFYLDVINVYNRSNVINYDYFVTEDLKLGKKATTMFPIVPTLGFNARF